MSGTYLRTDYDNHHQLVIHVVDSVDLLINIYLFLAIGKTIRDNNS